MQRLKLLVLNLAYYIKKNIRDKEDERKQVIRNAE